jgi:glycosyltransferase involved in cell wall biosynthesis
LIRGAGVDTTEFACYPEPEGMPLVVLPARMLWDKGVAEFVRAARCVRGTGVQARFALVGASDPQNPACVPPEQLAAWQDEGVVECWGRHNDMPSVMRSCAVVCLPSYREGLPKALLEAASSGRAIVTYDVPGCREVVTDGVNGILVAPRDEPALNAALVRLLADRGLRERMGTLGRARVMEEFSQERVAAETMAVWREVAGNDGEWA